MESETAEIPFSGDWESLVKVAGDPKGLFSILPYSTELFEKDGRRVIRLKVRRLLLRFEFEGVLELALNRPYITHVLKGKRGLLILSFAAGENLLLVRASGDIPGERRLSKKLKLLAVESGRVVARFSESYGIVVPRVSESSEKFKIRDINPDVLPHLARFVRLKTGLESFTIEGFRENERFLARIRNGIVETVELENSKGSSILSVGKSLPEVSGEDFLGLDVEGEYELRVLE